jgi:signal transduction histidine kinase
MFMKKFLTWMVLAVVALVTGMTVIYWREFEQVRDKIAHTETVAQRQNAALTVMMELDRFRRASSRFRLIPEGEVAAAKERLKTEFGKGMAALAKLEPTPEEKALEGKVSDQLAELMAMSARLEPMLFSRDIYYKEPVRDLHDSMIKNLTQIGESAKTRASAERQGIVGSGKRSMGILVACAAAVVVLLAMILFRGFFVFTRPIRKLHGRAQALAGENGATPGAQPLPPLGGLFGGIETVLNDLHRSREALRKERHQFIHSVASDLRTPLVTLQSGAGALAQAVAEGKLDETGRLQAAEVVRRSSVQLERMLDDLDDIVEFDRKNLRLEERIVDLRDVLTDASRVIGGPGSLFRVAVTVPTLPIWASVDARKLERVLVNLMAKLARYQPQGGRLELSMVLPTGGAFRGVEIHVQEAERQIAGGKAGRPTGPEQDLLRHWVSENGFSMALAQRIAKAHGGSITASGVAGTQVHFIVRIPQERVASGVNAHAGSPAQLTSQAGAAAGAAAGQLEAPATAAAPVLRTRWASEAAG